MSKEKAYVNVVLYIYLLNSRGTKEFPSLNTP